MTVLSYQTIKRLAQTNRLIEPFYEKELHHSGTTGGVSECGYDIRIAQDLILYPISLKNLGLAALGVARPSFALASSLEKFNLSDSLMFHVTDKSTLARIGLSVQNTVAEPGWSGWLTLELTNHGRSVIYLKEGQPIAQVMFHWLDEPTQKPYHGKYQHQKAEPQEAIFDKPAQIIADDIQLAQTIGGYRPINRTNNIGAAPTAVLRQPSSVQPANKICVK